MTPSRRGLLVAVIAALALAGCTSDGSERAAPTTTTTPSRRAARVEQIVIDANGLTFNARAAGSKQGELVLLLHGFPQSGYEWRSQLTALAQAGYRAIAPDHRGYSPGARPTTDDQYTIDHMVDDTIAIADELGAKRFHVVGHDWGAGVAWATAIAHPARLQSLTAVSVPHPAAYARASADPDGEQHDKQGYIDAFTAPGAAAGLASEAFLRAAFGTAVTDADIVEYTKVLGSPEAMDAALAWYRANDLKDGLGADAPAVKVPTLFVFGTEDCCLGRDAADLTSDYVTGPYTYEVLTGVNHWIPEAAAPQLNRSLIRHLRKHSS